MFRAVFERLAGDGVVVGFVRLPEIGRVGIRQGALLLHPVKRGAGIEAPGKSDADSLADRETFKNDRHFVLDLGPFSVRGKERCTTWDLRTGKLYFGDIVSPDGEPI